MVKRRSLRIGSNTTLSMYRDCYLLENVKLLSSNLVKLNLAMAPLLRAMLCANTIVGFDFTRFTSIWA